MKQKKVALVIGAGSVECATALGVLCVLKQANISLDMVIGCSGGSLYAAAVALGWDVETTVSLTRRLWTHDLIGRHNNRSLLQAIFPKRLGFDGRFGLRDDALILQRLEKTFGSYSFADTQIPLFITATDMFAGEQVVLRNGRLVDALRAGIAMPFVFAPWELNGRLLADGYISDPLPSNVAIQEGADIIIALGFEAPTQQKINSPLRYAFQLSSIMTNSIFKARIAFHTLTHHTDILLLTPQFRQRINRFDTDKFPAIIHAGEEAMTAQLPYLQELLAK